MGVLNRALIVLLILSFLARLLFLFNDSVVWDAAVYIGMGKYIFSAGESGLWEASRPLLWPFLLGFLWRIKLDPVVFGRIVTTLFSLGCIYLVYLIGETTFNRKIALLSGILFSFSPTFFNSNSVLLTEIPSTFFSLLAVYFFIKDKSALSGFFFGLSFLTRFFQSFILLSLLLLLYSRKEHTYFLRKLFMTFIFFILTLTPYLLINNLLYSNPLFPFSLQLFLTQHSGWFWFEPFRYYFINLLKENFISIFSLVGIFLVFAKPRQDRVTIAIILLAVLAVLSIPLHKEMRFLIPLLPYVYILGAYGLFCLLNKLKRYKTVTILTITLLFISIFFQLIPSFKSQTFYNDIEFQDYTKNINGEIWISNPTYLVKTDKKASELIYYPIFDDKRSKEILSRLEEADFILLNTCDIPCNPEDFDCPKITQEFIEILKENFKAYYKKIDGCERYVFTSS